MPFVTCVYGTIDKRLENETLRLSLKAINNKVSNANLRNHREFQIENNLSVYISNFMTF